MIRLVFWQIIIDQLQLPYIVHIIDDKRVGEVIVVTGEEISLDRESMGWNTYFPGLDKCKLFIAPSEQTVRQIISEKQENSIHLFSGIRGFECVYRNFLISLDYNVKRGIITERPLTYAHGVDWAKPLWLHKLRFMIQDRKYIPHIDYILGIGEECCDYYRSISSKWKVIPFMYCTVDNAINQDKQDRESICRIVYVGSLSKRKSVMTLLETVKELSKEGYEDSYILTIVGDGPERESLEYYAGKNNLSNVEFLGMVKNKELPNLLSKQDVLVLPSIHDGWGAVINEALQAGLYAVCSDKCGAKEMLVTDELGRVFLNKKQLLKILSEIIFNIEKIRRNTGFRRKWAKNHISGSIISSYMVDALSGNGDICPWKTIL